MAEPQSFQGLASSPTQTPYNRLYYTLFMIQLIIYVIPLGCVWLACRIIVLAWTSRSWPTWLTLAVCALTLVVGYIAILIYAWVDETDTELRRAVSRWWLLFKTTFRPVRGRNPWNIYDLLPPLKDHEIRLLRVRSRYGGLFCDIQHVDITSKPNLDIVSQSYTAISYTWGSGVRDHYIYWGWTAIPVTGSCVEALKACNRSKGSEGDLYWIDQLCIDQSNPVEKGRQVQMMGEIYAKADKVLIWLGNPWFSIRHIKEHAFPPDWVQLPEILKLQEAINSHGFKAFKSQTRKPVVRYTNKRPLHALTDIVILKGLVLAATLVAWPFSVWNPDDPREPNLKNAPPNVAALLADQSAWLGFFNIFRRQQLRDSYFRRRWIIQECKPIHSARQIDCHVGGFSISLKALSACIKTINIIRTEVWP